MKLTKRRGFNFFRSYYDVYNELNNEDKVAFMDALLDRQFQGIKPTELKGMAKFAYISQTNSIDSQVKGYEDKTKVKLTPTLPPTAPPRHGGKLPPTLQEKEKVQEKEKEKEEEVGELITTTESIRDINVLEAEYLKNKRVVKAVVSEPKNRFQNLGHLEDRLKEFVSHLTQQSETAKSMKDFSSHFRYWHIQNISKVNNGTRIVNGKIRGII